MPDHSQSERCIDRRAFLTAVGVSAFTSFPVSAQEDDDAESSRAADEYVLEQSGTCVPLVPLSDPGRTVDEFYDYRAHFTDPSSNTYSTHGTMDLQRDDTSIVFLYEGADGLSLVVVHDKLYGDSDGGAVSFDITGLPADGEWVVEDDNYDSSSNYDTFTHDGSRSSIDWTWWRARTDGAAFNGLGESFELTVTPAFNEDAALYGDHYDGELTAWHALSGDRTNPERISLTLDQPITIRTGSCEAGSTPEEGEEEEQPEDGGAEEDDTESRTDGDDQEPTDDDSTSSDENDDHHEETDEHKEKDEEHEDEEHEDEEEKDDWDSDDDDDEHEEEDDEEEDWADEHDEEDKEVEQKHKEKKKKRKKRKKRKKKRRKQRKKREKRRKKKRKGKKKRK